MVHVFKPQNDFLKEHESYFPSSLTPEKIEEFSEKKSVKDLRLKFHETLRKMPPVPPRMIKKVSFLNKITDI